MLTYSWEAVANEALLGDNELLPLAEETQATLRHARALYRDGSTPDAEIAAVIATIEDRPPVRLQ